MAFVDARDHEILKSELRASNGARGDLTPLGGDKRGDNAKTFAVEKRARYRAICVALDVSPRNTSAAVPVV